LRNGTLFILALYAYVNSLQVAIYLFSARILILKYSIDLSLKYWIILSLRLFYGWMQYSFRCI